MPEDGLAVFIGHVTDWGGGRVAPSNLAVPALLSAATPSLSGLVVVGGNSDGCGERSSFKVNEILVNMAADRKKVACSLAD